VAPPAPISPAFTGASSWPQAFDAASIRNDFPILQEKIHGRRLIWLDNGATTQKPQAVIDRLAAFYAHENSNVHRGAHTLAARATDAYEAARGKVRRFVGASSPNEIVFVRGTTEGINLVAQAWGRRNVKAGDEIVVTWLEHHANIVPWQQLFSRRGRGSASRPSMTTAISCSTNTKGYSAHAPVLSRCRRSRTRLALSRLRAR
jgi:cysteine desulfurase/selenocysteine lyase